MHKVVSVSLSNRRLLALLAVGLLLAAFLLTQLPALRSVKANVKTLVATPCTSADIAGSSRGWSDPGDGATTLTASSSACTTPEYKFLLLAPGTTTWVAVTGYTTSPTYDWVTTTAKQGVWQIAVWVRAVGSTVKYQAYAIGSETLLRPLCLTAHLTASPASPQVAGTAVTLTTAVTNCTGPEFEFWELAPGSTTWVVAQPWTGGGVGGGQTYNWDTTALAPGAYRFSVWAKQFDSSRRYDSYSTLTFWITA